MNGEPAIHIELTSKCAVACPKCPRTEYGDQLKFGDLSMENLQKILRHPWQSILFCGNHGDPIYHSRFHEVLELIGAMQPRPSLYIETNGSHRSKEWWSKTAELLGPKDTVSFSIDGLEDTNHLYRVNARWDTIMAGIEILRAESACQLEWKFILFRHNQHQIGEACRRAKQWNMSFRLVRSSRFDENDPMEPTLNDFAQV